MQLPPVLRQHLAALAPRCRRRLLLRAGRMLLQLVLRARQVLCKSRQQHLALQFRVQLQE